MTPVEANGVLCPGSATANKDKSLKRAEVSERSYGLKVVALTLQSNDKASVASVASVLSQGTQELLKLDADARAYAQSLPPKTVEPPVTWEDAIQDTKAAAMSRAYREQLSTTLPPLTPLTPLTPQAARITPALFLARALSPESIQRWYRGFPLNEGWS